MPTRLEDVIFKPQLNKDWHMQISERVALMHILHALQPDVSIEIGTFLGGSLRPIAAASKRVYTFDIDPNQHRYSDEFTNVKFVTGDSAQTLPVVIDELNAGDEELNFILVDGSHDEEGVKSDLLQCVRYIPKSQPTVILAHDSANPEVRRGIKGVDWALFPHVHSVSIDYVPGIIFDRQDIYRQMWGGLAAIVLMPELRDGDVLYESSFGFAYQILWGQSVHNRKPMP